MSHFTEIDFAQILSANAYLLAYVTAIIIATWVVNIGISRFIEKFSKTLKSKKRGGKVSVWAIAFASSISTPLKIFIWVAGLGIATELINEDLKSVFLGKVLNLRPIIHIAITVWFLLRFKNHLLPLISSSNGITKESLDVVDKISTIVIILASILTILPNMGISISGLLAFGGVGGILVGLAAKDFMANIFAAIMLHFDRPFSIGDWISLPEKNLEGIVESIGWRQVNIRTFDKKLVFVPNFMFSSMILMNPARMTHRRINETIGIAFEDVNKIPVIIEQMRGYLDSIEELDKGQSVNCYLDKFMGTSAEVVISAFLTSTELADFIRVKESILLKAAEILKDNQVSLAEKILR